MHKHERWLQSIPIIEMFNRNLSMDAAIAHPTGQIAVICIGDRNPGRLFRRQKHVLVCHSEHAQLFQLIESMVILVRVVDYLLKSN